MANNQSRRDRTHGRVVRGRVRREPRRRERARDPRGRTDPVQVRTGTLHRGAERVLGLARERAGQGHPGPSSHDDDLGVGLLADRTRGERTPGRTTRSPARALCRVGRGPSAALDRADHHGSSPPGGPDGETAPGSEPAVRTGPEAHHGGGPVVGGWPAGAGGRGGHRRIGDPPAGTVAAADRSLIPARSGDRGESVDAGISSRCPPTAEAAARRWGNASRQVQPWSWLER